MYTRDLETICAHWREDSQTKDDTYYVRDYLVYFAPNKTELRTPETNKVRFQKKEDIIWEFFPTWGGGSSQIPKLL